MPMDQVTEYNQNSWHQPYQGSPCNTYIPTIVIDNYTVIISMLQLNTAIIIIIDIFIIITMDWLLHYE